MINFIVKVYLKEFLSLRVLDAHSFPAQPFKMKMKPVSLSVRLALSLSLSFHLFSTPQKSCLWVFQSKGCHWAPTKAKDSWRLDPDEVHYLITDSRKHLMLFSLLFGRKRGGLTEAGLSARWENWKREVAEGDGGKGCSPFIFVCLTASVGRRKEKGGGSRGGVKRERERA